MAKLKSTGWWLGVALSGALMGCSSMSGLTGSSEYSCKAPPGVHCDSMSATYENAIRKQLPSQQPQPYKGSGNSSDGESRDTAYQKVTMANSDQERGPRSVYGPATLRSQPRILRVWFKPWVDQDQDLFDQGYIYVTVDGGRWLVDSAQAQIRGEYRPVRPPPARAATSPEPAPPATRFRGPLSSSSPTDDARGVVDTAANHPRED